ncbi:MAG TPA: NUDIX hydrolase [Armatimonadota bacterium]
MTPEETPGSGIGPDATRPKIVLNEVVIDTRPIYQGRMISLRSDRVRLPDGSESRRDVVEHRGAVTIVPMLPDGQVVMVRQFRLAAGSILLELPAGTRDPDEDAEVCARRELTEETGYRAGRMEKLFEAFMAPGYSSELIHFYLAQDLDLAEQATDEDEFVEVVQLPLSEAIRQASEGELRDAKTIAGLLVAAQRLGHLRPDEAE